MAIRGGSGRRGRQRRVRPRDTLRAAWLPRTVWPRNASTTSPPRVADRRAVRSSPLPRCARQRRRAAQTGKGTDNDREDGRHWRAGGVRRRSPDLSDAAWQARRGVLLCHVMLRADVFQIRIEPNSATVSRDVGMNGATARKDAGGVVAGGGALGSFVEEHRTALANDAARRTGRAPPAFTDREPEHRTACRHAHAVWQSARGGPWRAREREASSPIRHSSLERHSVSLVA